MTLAEPDKLGDDGFSVLFGADNRDFLQEGEGLSLLILESRDAAAAAGFCAAGIAGADAMRFGRVGKRPDGSPVKLGFSLAFAADRLAPRIHFATCQQHHPENFWDPAFQKHANGAQTVAGVIVVANEPAHHLNFMQNFSGATAAQIDGGFSLLTPRGAVEILTPAAFLRRYGVAPPNVSRGAKLAALRFFVADAGCVRALPDSACVAGLGAGRGAVLDAMGAVLVFEPAAEEGR